VNLGTIIPGVRGLYETSLAATVTSTAANATLSVGDPSAVASGRLVNGAFALSQSLQARATNAAKPDGTFAPISGSDSPLTLLTYGAQITSDAVSIGLRQPVLGNEALRTGTYSKTLTFVLSTTAP
jgi:hypothetical protein